MNGFQTTVALGYQIPAAAVEKAARRVLREENPVAAKSLKIGKFRFVSALAALTHIRCENPGLPQIHGPPRGPDTELFQTQDGKCGLTSITQGIEIAFRLPRVLQTDSSEYLITKNELVIIDDNGNPYRRFHESIPLTSVLAELHALNELRKKLEALGLPVGEPMVLASRESE